MYPSAAFVPITEMVPYGDPPDLPHYTRNKPIMMESIYNTRECAYEDIQAHPRLQNTDVPMVYYSDECLKTLHTKMPTYNRVQDNDVVVDPQSDDQHSIPTITKEMAQLTTAFFSKPITKKQLIKSLKQKRVIAKDYGDIPDSESEHDTNSRTESPQEPPLRYPQRRVQIQYLLNVDLGAYPEPIFAATDRVELLTTYGNDNRIFEIWKKQTWDPPSSQLYQIYGYLHSLQEGVKPYSNHNYPHFIIHDQYSHRHGLRGSPADAWWAIAQVWDTQSSPGNISAKCWLPWCTNHHGMDDTTTIAPGCFCIHHRNIAHHHDFPEPAHSEHLGQYNAETHDYMHGAVAFWTKHREATLTAQDIKEYKQMIPQWQQKWIRWEADYLARSNNRNRKPPPPDDGKEEHKRDDMDQDGDEDDHNEPQHPSSPIESKEESSQPTTNTDTQQSSDTHQPTDAQQPSDQTESEFNFESDNAVISNMGTVGELPDHQSVQQLDHNFFTHNHQSIQQFETTFTDISQSQPITLISSDSDDDVNNDSKHDPTNDQTIVDRRNSVHRTITSTAPLIQPDFSSPRTESTLSVTSHIPKLGLSDNQSSESHKHSKEEDSDSATDGSIQSRKSKSNRSKRDAYRHHIRHRTKPLKSSSSHSKRDYKRIYRPSLRSDKHGRRRSHKSLSQRAPTHSDYTSTSEAEDSLRIPKRSSTQQSIRISTNTNFARTHLLPKPPPKPTNTPLPNDDPLISAEIHALRLKSIPQLSENNEIRVISMDPLWAVLVLWRWKTIEARKISLSKSDHNRPIIIMPNKTCSSQLAQYLKWPEIQYALQRIPWFRDVPLQLKTIRTRLHYLGQYVLGTVTFHKETKELTGNHFFLDPFAGLPQSYVVDAKYYWHVKSTTIWRESHRLPKPPANRCGGVYIPHGNWPTYFLKDNHAHDLYYEYLHWSLCHNKDRNQDSPNADVKTYRNSITINDKPTNQWFGQKAPSELAIKKYYDQLREARDAKGKSPSIGIITTTTSTQEPNPPSKLESANHSKKGVDKQQPPTPISTIPKLIKKKTNKQSSHAKRDPTATKPPHTKNNKSKGKDTKNEQSKETCTKTDKPQKRSKKKNSEKTPSRNTKGTEKSSGAAKSTESTKPTEKVNTTKSTKSTKPSGPTKNPKSKRDKTTKQFKENAHSKRKKSQSTQPTTKKAATNSKSAAAQTKSSKNPKPTKPKTTAGKHSKSATAKSKPTKSKSTKSKSTKNKSTRTNGKAGDYSKSTTAGHGNAIPLLKDKDCIPTKQPKEDSPETGGAFIDLTEENATIDNSQTRPVTDDEKTGATQEVSSPILLTRKRRGTGRSPKAKKHKANTTSPNSSHPQPPPPPPIFQAQNTDSDASTGSTKKRKSNQIALSSRPRKKRRHKDPQQYQTYNNDQYTSCSIPRYISYFYDKSDPDESPGRKYPYSWAEAEKRSTHCLPGWGALETRRRVLYVRLMRSSKIKKALDADTITTNEFHQWCILSRFVDAVLDIYYGIEPYYRSRDTDDAILKQIQTIIIKQKSLIPLNDLHAKWIERARELPILKQLQLYSTWRSTQSRNNPTPFALKYQPDLNEADGIRHADVQQHHGETIRRHTYEYQEYAKRIAKCWNYLPDKYRCPKETVQRETLFILQDPLVKIYGAQWPQYAPISITLLKCHDAFFDLLYYHSRYNRRPKPTSLQKPPTIRWTNTIDGDFISTLPVDELRNPRYPLPPNPKLPQYHCPSLPITPEVRMGIQRRRIKITYPVPTLPSRKRKKVKPKPRNKDTPITDELDEKGDAPITQTQPIQFDETSQGHTSVGYTKPTLTITQSDAMSVESESAIDCKAAALQLRKHNDHDDSKDPDGYQNKGQTNSTMISHPKPNQPANTSIQTDSGTNNTKTTTNMLPTFTPLNEQPDFLPNLYSMPHCSYLHTEPLKHIDTFNIVRTQEFVSDVLSTNHLRFQWHSKNHNEGFVCFAFNYADYNCRKSTGNTPYQFCAEHHAIFGTQPSSHVDDIHLNPEVPKLYHIKLIPCHNEYTIRNYPMPTTPGDMLAQWMMYHDDTPLSPLSMTPMTPRLPTPRLPSTPGLETRTYINPFGDRIDAELLFRQCRCTLTREYAQCIIHGHRVVGTEQSVSYDCTDYNLLD